MDSTLLGWLERDLGSSLQGELILPSGAGYADARAVFNAMIDRRPVAIARCADAADVARAVVAARRHGLLVSVRGGGHSVAGNAVRDEALMLDMSAMKGIEVDAGVQRVRAQSGLLLGEFDRATGAHGLATPLGVVSVTGIAGLTLGGGLGWLNGRYGLACDNLTAAEVVTADGELVWATEEQNADLLWGLRGGGGNFGVVTSFEYQLHPVSTVLAGGVSFSRGMVPEVLGFYDTFAKTAPDELSTAASLGLDADGEPVVSVAVCWSGPIDEGHDVLRPLLSFGPPIAGGVEPMPYPAWQSTPDTGFPPGRLHYWKSGFLAALSEGAIDTLMRFVPEMPSAFSGVGLQQMHGVASRVAPTATAFQHRAEHYDLLILSQWPDAVDSQRNIEWTRRLFEAMTPHLEDAVYVNNLGDEGPARVRAAYGANYERLAALKQSYDPDNIFRANQNIAPLSTSSS